MNNNGIKMLQQPIISTCQPPVDTEAQLKSVCTQTNHHSLSAPRYKNVHLCQRSSHSTRLTGVFQEAD